MNDAICNDYPRALFFIARGATAPDAKVVCSGCAVRADCLAYALDDLTLQGVWGGTTERERRQLRGQRAA
jgi:WhiB family redox-sensing transcriptional regulator